MNAKGGLHENALQAAAALGKVDLARLLLDSGANVDATGDGGYTALQVAAFSGRSDMIELLVSRSSTKPSTCDIKSYRCFEPCTK